ncbi:inner centromere protein-like isoform X2 [Entelurus aequoreus]|uniref:inner centromere protein-like isoform X2 n=1 Tax=Entelurus aequoreus TaxID=161455 RepID=UPI002B1CF833|nr:inner centromere protein-like isoform X2 [Entelurus aequoreus]
MSSVLSSVRTLMQMFDEKKDEFIREIDNVHMVWLEEIQQEANRMFSRDFNTELELMPKTPSQKKNSRRKRVSVGRQEEGQTRRFSKGRRSNLRGSAVKSLNFIAEDESSAAQSRTRPQHTTRRNKQTLVEEDVSQVPLTSNDSIEECKNKKKVVEDEGVDTNSDAKIDEPCHTSESPVKIPSPNVVVSIPASEHLSAEYAKQPEPSPGRKSAKIAIAGNARRSRRSSVRCSLKVRHSLTGLRHSMKKESLLRASQRSMMKRKVARMDNSSCSSSIDDVSNESTEETVEKVAVPEDTWPETRGAEPSLARVTRSVAANSPKLAPPSLFTPDRSTMDKRILVPDELHTSETSRRSSQSIKRKAPYTVEESPKRFSPPKKSRSAARPNMTSFLHTVQKNQMLMMTPNSFSRNPIMKSFIKYNTPLKIDPKTKERQKLEALKKKQEQEEERMRKMEEEKKKKQEEFKRKRDERLRKVLEAKIKEEQREEEKKKKVEQKMANIDGKNDKRQAEERAKKRIAIKRQEELEQKRKLEEETKKKKIQQAEEEKRQQELLVKKAKEEEIQAKKLAQARRALEMKREQEREKELERERQAAAEREQAEKEKALTLQRELQRAAREKERGEMEDKIKALEKKRQEEEQRLAAEEKAAKEREAAAATAVVALQAANAHKTAANLNVTVDIERSVMTTPAGKGCGLNVTVDKEKSPQWTYLITPKGGKNAKTMSKNSEDYGMDQNSDDSTDDESAPKKQIPSWAEGHNLQKIIMKQYFNPPDLDSFFGSIEAPKLENIFYKSKPRYFKRTSSAVWHSPPVGNK